MFHSLLITHPNETTRNTYIEKLLREEKIAKLDQLFLTDESIGIAEIRKLILFTSNKPLQSNFKVIILLGDNLTLEAQHALLKLLEEPPHFIRIFISITQSEKLLETIRSRATIIQLKDLHHELENTSMHEKYWKELLAQKPIARLKNIDTPTERDEVKEWLKEAIFFIRSQLLSSLRLPKSEISSFNTRISLQVIEELVKAYNNVAKNASVRLTLDHLLLNLN